MSILDLSVELFLEIAGHLDSDDYVAARATCTSLASAVDPSFFGTLILPTNRLTAEMLAAIGQQGSPWSMHTRTLLVAPGRRNLPQPREHSDEGGVVEEEERVEDKREELLVAALTRLARVSVVRFKVDNNDPGWLLGAVFSAFQYLPLRELELKIEHRQILLPPFPNSDLQVLKVHGPIFYRAILLRHGSGSLEEEDPAVPPLVSQIAAIVARNPELQELHVFNDEHWDDVWRTLSRGPIRLRSLATNRINKLALEYLGAYSGLERLRIVGHDMGNIAANDRYATIFFEEVLSKHAATLRELRCLPAYECRWCFGRHNEPVLRDMTALRALEMAVNSAEMHGECEETPIPLFFQLASTLPSLTTFAILTSNRDALRRVRCGNSRRQHRESMREAGERVADEYLLASGLADRIRKYSGRGAYGASDAPAYASEWDSQVASGPTRLRPTPAVSRFSKGGFRAYLPVIWAGEVVRSGL
ncbi:F-box domain-containing protein [Mycena kentingensis (nom. inval.)]|nr:F-box domain-containing protein [Mycena kentingensis (nom. inval.)]